MAAAGDAFIAQYARAGIRARFGKTATAGKQKWVEWFVRASWSPGQDSTQEQAPGHSYWPADTLIANDFQLAVA